MNARASQQQEALVLLAPGWDDGNPEQYDQICRALHDQGWATCCVDFPGRENGDASRQNMNRDQNLKELVAAYDGLVDERPVGQRSVAFIGISYGGYLGTLLSAQRPLQWMVLRSPALYRDEDWLVPKQELDKDDLDQYRRSMRSPEENSALAACAAFKGDVLLIESEDDETVPHPAVKSFKSAFKNARSLTYRLLEGADHELSDQSARSRFRYELMRWMNEVAGRPAAAENGEAHDAA